MSERTAHLAPAAMFFYAPTLQAPAFRPSCCVCHRAFGIGDVLMLTTSHDPSTGDPKDIDGAFWCREHEGGAPS